MSTGIRRAEPDEAAAVANLIGTAFEALEVARWMMPPSKVGAAERARRLAGQFTVIVGHVIEHGCVHVLGDYRAAAVWMPQDPAVELPPPDRYDELLASAAGPYLAGFQALDELFEANHPHERHEHLAFLAAHPEVQGQGLGSVLLRHHHATLDASGTAGYLEASNPRSAALYERHGYRPHGDPMYLPDGPPLYPMWRDPA